jgi:tRNA A-37 threonylcarbamoyl transferase component Bud32
MLSQVGKFRIIRRIGQGAMGEVYLAEDPVMGCNVALKMIRLAAGDEAETRARFEREARSAARLNHPGVVTVHEFGEEAGHLYLVMEFVEGEDLLELLQRGGLSRVEFLEVLAQVCDALGEAHARGIIHRDVKPSNIRVLRQDGRLRAKVMDFGVAQMANSDLTSDGIWMGTLSYMAPEYLDTGRALPASDLFAVGVMLYEGLTRGRKPFPGDTPSMVLNRILLHPPDPLEPGELEGMNPLLLPILSRALAKLPGDRFSSAEEFGEALRALGNPEGAGGQLVLDLAETDEMEPFDPEREPTVRLEAKGFRTGGAGGLPRPAEILVVSKGGQGDCLSLAVALRRAAPGSRILVKPGTYRESLTVDKPVEILAAGDASEVVLEGQDATCLTIQSEGVHVCGFSLMASGASTDQGFPALEVASGSAVLEDCVLTSDGLTAVSVQGEGTRLSMARCRVQNCPGVGVRVAGHAQALFERCALSGLGGAGILVELGGSPTLRRCTIHHTHGGVLVQQEARGLFEDCNIYRNSRSGVGVQGHTQALFRRCRIHDGEDFGVSCASRGQASFEDCDIYGHASSNVQITGGGNPHFRQCRIHDGQEYGVLATDEALGTLESCDIFGHKLSGMVVTLGANPLIRSCRIHGGQGTGVNVSEGGLGALEDCEISDNLLAGLKVGKGGNPVLRRCRLIDGRGEGASFLARSQGTVAECEVRGNAKGGIRVAKDAHPSISGGKIPDGIQREGGMLGRWGF